MNILNLCGLNSSGKNGYEKHQKSSRLGIPIKYIRTKGAFSELLDCIGCS